MSGPAGIYTHSLDSLTQYNTMGKSRDCESQLYAVRVVLWSQVI